MCESLTVVGKAGGRSCERKSRGGRWWKKNWEQKKEASSQEAELN